MIKSVTITNHLGAFVTIELRRPELSGFFIRGGIEGLAPAKATININQVATLDGAMFNSARVNSRNIVFSLGFMTTDTLETIEDVRHECYKFFPIKKRIKMVVETDNRICETYGYVESNEPDIFSKEQGTTISVICPDSYFYSPNRSVKVFSSLDSLFEFPFSNESTTENLIEFGNLQINTEKSIWYVGDAPVGILIFAHATGEVRNIRIANINTREVMVIDTSRFPSTIPGQGVMEEGDDLYISTIRGDKFIMLERHGVLYNVLSSLGSQYDWFTLERDDNLFTYTAEQGVANLQFRIENNIAYEGI